MEREYDTKARYLDGGGKPIWKEEFDFLLVRQDFNGFESVYFNIDEIEDIYDLISEGDIPIHMNYSILYGKTRKTLDEITNKGYGFPCYDVAWDER